MGEDDADTLSVDELVEYCRTQAGLLSGSVERMGAEADELLDEIDAEMATIRTRLEERPDAVTEPESPSSAVGPGSRDREADLAEIEALEADLEEKQTIVEAKQARMEAFQSLAADYTDLATDLQRDSDGWQAALEQIVQFEADHDAPAYFPDRQTLLEAAMVESETDDED
ncbi:hypothetical protein HALLA_13225 [Halostagnicola larsenii XH-48]|uniref:Uncharacterized protein n=1 Tax=Halostagnicola larsenii XH-48 TaxID=797299 RepID=W0JLJ5_9EURY|nr:hypothetical protein [Halostagnicola larsenii]AHF99610.1 hypothetical protein HALLA_13225 [Halostagnicola larsenii XH-48]